MILCTFPGRHGDILWALPTVRAISEAVGEPVGLQIAGEFNGLEPLLDAQPYIAFVYADSRWGLTPPEEWQAPKFSLHPPIERVVHLGYRGWPQLPLAQETYATGVAECAKLGVTLPPLELERPWISTTPYPHRTDVAVGFTDEHFELKYGVHKLLMRYGADHWADLAGAVLVPPGGRWATEGRYTASTWLEAAADLANTRVFLGCCSALHVLAVALGVPVVLMEPSAARHADIFYPLGKTGRVYLVTGNDGQPTFDARAVAQAIEDRL